MFGRLVKEVTDNPRFYNRLEEMLSTSTHTVLLFTHVQTKKVQSTINTKSQIYTYRP